MYGITKISATFFLAFTISAAYAQPLSHNAEDKRRISFYNIHTKETIAVIYKRNGQYQAEAMKRINWILRDWRRNIPTRMDPKLIDLAWEMHRELGSQQPIHVISGFRSQKTNNMLRRTRGGQARRSQHILGKAMDIRFPDVPVRRLRYAGLIRERGGVGYYPTSGTPFVHIDTGRVRHWPRMARSELALLFPDGRTKHRPRGGRRITPRDAKLAKRRLPDLAKRVAAYHDLRRSGLNSTRIAAATPSGTPKPWQTSLTLPRPPQPRLIERPRLAVTSPAYRPKPQLLALPRLIDRPSRIIPGPTLADRRALTRLAAFAATFTPTPSISPSQNRDAQRIPNGVSAAPQAPTPSTPGAVDDISSQLTAPSDTLGQPTSFITSPQYDEEHPEELSYRPFPILPFLTTTKDSPYGPSVPRLVHPDTSRAIAMLDHEGSAPPMQLKPGAQTARLLWLQAFTGKAVNINALSSPPPPSLENGARPTNLSSRRVTTSDQ